MRSIMKQFTIAAIALLVSFWAEAGALRTEDGSFSTQAPDSSIGSQDSIQNLSTKYLERFNKFIQQRDTIFAKSVLSDWTEDIPNDPELYVAWFSYYYNTALVEQAIVSKRPSQSPNDTNMEMTDSTGAVTGYIVTRRIFLPTQSAKAIEAINKGLENSPQRLDMRLYKIIMLGNCARWSDYADEIILLLKEMDGKRYTWQMSGGKEYAGAEEYVKEAVEEWQNNLFRMDSDGSNMRRIAESVLARDQKNISALNFLAISYLKDKEYSKAVQWLKKADKYSSNNAMILQNLALSYKLLGDRKNYALYDAKAKSLQNQQ